MDRMRSVTSSLRKRPDPRPTVCGVAVGIVGALALLGWVLEVERLKAIVPGFQTMKPLTAVGLFLLGTSLALQGSERRWAHRAAGAAACAAGAIGAVVVVEYVTSSSWGIDTVLFERAVRAEGGTLPGRMAPITAGCMAATGLSLVVRPRWHRVAHLGGLAVALAAMVALMGYLYGVSSLRHVGAYSTIALHTALSFVVLGIGLAWATPEEGLVRLSKRGGAPAVLIRRALPVVVVLPVVLGWLDLQGELAGWYDREFGVAIMAAGSAAIGAAVVWRSSISVAAFDEARARALHELEAANERLESEVVARTASLAAQAEIQEASLEALEQGVVLSTLDGEVLLLNRAGRALLGYSAEELTGRYQSGQWETYREDGSVMPPEERPVRRTMDTGAPTTGQIVRWKRKDGDVVTLRVTTRPIFDDAGTLTGVVTAAADVTAERAAQRAAAEHDAALRGLNTELERAVLIKDRFLATATHDMRTPITAITGFTGLLLRGGSGLSDQQVHMLEAIERQGQRLEALVQDLLSIAVIDGGAITVDPKPVDLSQVLPQIVADAGFAIEVTLDVEAPAMALVDPGRLAQMVTNLLQNAMKYGRPPVTLSHAAEGPWVTIRVRDCGDGVPAEFVPRLFDRFSTASRDVDPSKRSTGLGLAIVRGLADLQGGEVWYEPNEPTGACFALRLPTAPGA